MLTECGRVVFFPNMTPCGLGLARIGEGDEMDAEGTNAFRINL